MTPDVSESHLVIRLLRKAKRQLLSNINRRHRDCAHSVFKDGFEVTAVRKPNFFIIGAPKCGTTSLATWLSGHPNVFMSAVKEPHFFNTDDRRFISTLEAYENLFRAASSDHCAVGEASVWYLSSTEAVRNILALSTGRAFHRHGEKSCRDGAGVACGNAGLRT